MAYLWSCATPRLGVGLLGAPVLWLIRYALKFVTVTPNNTVPFWSNCPVTEAAKLVKGEFVISATLPVVTSNVKPSIGSGRPTASTAKVKRNFPVEDSAKLDGDCTVGKNVANPSMPVPVPIGITYTLLSPWLPVTPSRNCPVESACSAIMGRLKGLPNKGVRAPEVWSILKP